MPEELDPAWEYWTPSEEWSEAFPPSPVGFESLRVDGDWDEPGYNQGLRFGRENPDYASLRLKPGVELWQLPSPRVSTMFLPPRQDRPTKPILTKTCEYCFRDFYTRRERKRYCGWQCAHDASIVVWDDRECLRCGRTYQPNRGGQRYCSLSCNPGRTKTILAPKACLKCQRLFVPVKKSRQLCSKKCLGAKKVIPRELPCARCGTIFKPSHSHSRFCSRVCGGTLGGGKPPEPENLRTFQTLYLSGLLMEDIAAKLGVRRGTLARWRRILNLPLRKKEAVK